jgi:hypothetical protein
LDQPSAIRASTSRSRGGEALDRVAAAAEQLAYHLRVDHRAACGDPAHRVDELLHVADPVLEQVADAAAVAAARVGVEQLGGVGLLDVLAEHQHGQGRARGPQRQRGAQPLVGEPRRQRTSVTTTSGSCSRTAASSAGASPTAATTA